MKIECLGEELAKETGVGDIDIVCLQMLWMYRASVKQFYKAGIYCDV
jgi:hypothetical protein